MQAPTLVVSRDRYDIQSLRQEKPNDFKPSLFNTTAVNFGGSRCWLSPVPPSRAFSMSGMRGRFRTEWVLL
jgi:hypothetical protein